MKNWIRSNWKRISLFFVCFATCGCFLAWCCNGLFEGLAYFCSFGVSPGNFPSGNEIYDAFICGTFVGFSLTSILGFIMGWIFFVWITIDPALTSPSSPTKEEQP